MNRKTLVLLILYFSLAGASVAQVSNVNVSGIVQFKSNGFTAAFVNVVLKKLADSSFVSGTVTGDDGRYILKDIKPGNYFLEASLIGYSSYKQEIYIGSLSEYIEVPIIELVQAEQLLQEFVVSGKADDVSEKMDKKTYTVDENISQTGGSVLQAMQNLPGVTVQDGKVSLRGSDKIIVLIDGKQTALTGMGSQSGLDNIPASAIEKIELINNPSSKYDANGNAGIINIIYKKSGQDGFNNKAGLSGGLGSLWVRKNNLPGIRPQYTLTPKINPSLALNYRKDKANIFFQGDYLYTETLNKNEFTTRVYDDGTIINQQIKRNRNTHFATVRTGLDYNLNERNTLTVSGLLGTEKILDRGDEPFFNQDLSERYRLWQFLEDRKKNHNNGFGHLSA
ncbi:MAG: carboxypeptidase-like regulatory domain-containing protein [Bacteroidia bacterium]